MNQKKKYISNLANSLVANNKVMSGKDLAEHLNDNDFLTSYGTEYKGGRGIYKLIQGTYKWAEELGLYLEAQNIANAFVDERGKPAWDK